MAERLTRQQIAEHAIVHEAPAVRLPTSVDRNFELPTGVYLAMGGMFLAAALVMALGFAAPMMVVPTAIIAVFIGMFFAVPALWVRMKPDHPQQATAWHRFRRHGIMTPYGRSDAGADDVRREGEPLGLRRHPDVELGQGVRVGRAAAADQVRACSGVGHPRVVGPAKAPVKCVARGRAGTP